TTDCAESLIQWTTLSFAVALQMMPRGNAIATPPTNRQHRKEEYRGAIPHILFRDRKTTQWIRLTAVSLSHCFRKPQANRELLHLTRLGQLFESMHIGEANNC